MSVLLLFLLLAIGLALIWPKFRPEPDPAKVHPLVRELQEPITVTGLGFYLDGGSISLTFKDAAGKSLQAALPADPKRSYPRLFLGTNGVKRLTPDRKMEIATNLPGVIEVTDPLHTTLRLQQILDQQGPGFEQDAARVVLAAWRGDPHDHVNMLSIYLRGVLQAVGRVW